MVPKKSKPGWKVIQKNDPVAKNLSDPKFRKRVVESKKVYKRNKGKKVELQNSNLPHED